jgi:hypothetical protein
MEPTAVRTPDPSLVTTTHVTYALHALGLAIGAFGAATVIGTFVFGWPSIIAVIINYIKRDDARGTWLESSRISPGKSARSGSRCCGRVSWASSARSSSSCSSGLQSGRLACSLSESGPSIALREGGCGFGIVCRFRSTLRGSRTNPHGVPRTRFHGVLVTEFQYKVPLTKFQLR